MKKILLSMLVLIIISVAACQQAAKEPVMEKKPDVMEKAPATITATGDTAVDAVGNGLNNVDSVEKDLSTDGLSGLDAGLDDVQKI
ncbi:hypothetical protein J4480_03570 [Candidatus Woesearchaeota archaeon]|nr:hypothetical protein [Candidatus Woesearchaeota archaeon]